MAIIEDNSIVSDHFSNVSSASPPVKTQVMPVKKPRPRYNQGGYYGRGYTYGYSYPYPVAPVAAYPPYVVPPVISTAEVIPPAMPAAQTTQKNQPATKEATPIDMMGFMPYLVAGGLSGVAGYFIAEKNNKNAWYGAGIGAGAMIGLVFLYNKMQKK